MPSACTNPPPAKRSFFLARPPNLAIDFLKNRPKEKPFFLMCHHKAPHRAWEPDEKHRAMFASRQIPEPPTLRDDYATRRHDESALPRYCSGIASPMIPWLPLVQPLYIPYLSLIHAFLIWP